MSSCQPSWSWLPAPKKIIREILSDAVRPLSKPLAYLAVALDADDRKWVTVTGYATQWGWSRGKVSRYLDALGVSICYPESTFTRQNQRGLIMLQIPDGSRTDDRQIKLHVFGALQSAAARDHTDAEQNVDRLQVATNYTNTDNNTDTTTPLGMVAITGEDVDDYIILAIKNKKPSNPGGYARSIRKRIKKQGGLYPEDLQQLASWKTSALEAKIKAERLAAIEEADREMAEVADANYENIIESLPEELRSAIESARNPRRRGLRVVK